MLPEGRSTGGSKRLEMRLVTLRTELFLHLEVDFIFSVYSQQ